MPEKWYLLGKGFYTPMINAFGITSSLPITQDVINQTLKHLMNTYTLFRMCIKTNEDGVLCFCKMGTDTLNNIKAEIRIDTDWKIAVDELRDNHIFDFETGPLWKCIFLPNATINDNLGENPLQHNCVVIFIQDHSINDGIGSVEMMQTFMLILNELLDENEVDTHLSPPVLPMDYSLDLMHRNALKNILILLGQTLLTFKCMKCFLDWILDQSLPKQSDEQVVSDKDRKLQGEKTTRTDLKILGKKETRKLIQACKNNGCTVQGAIQAASNVALLRAFDTHGIKRPLDLKNCVPMDLRKRLPKILPGFQLGSYGYSKSIVLDFEEGVIQADAERLWKFARQITEVVRAKVKELLPLPMEMYILSGCTDRYFDRLMKLDMMRHHSLLISSLGRFTVPDSATTHARPVGFLFSTSASRFDLMFTAYAVTINDQLSISHSYYPHTTSASMTKDYIYEFQEVMELLIKDGK